MSSDSVVRSPWRGFMSSDSVVRSGFVCSIVSRSACSLKSIIFDVSRSACSLKSIMFDVSRVLPDSLPIFSVITVLRSIEIGDLGMSTWLSVVDVSMFVGCRAVGFCSRRSCLKESREMAEVIVLLFVMALYARTCKYLLKNWSTAL